MLTHIIAFKHLFQITVGPKQIDVQSLSGPYEARSGNKTSRCVDTAVTPAVMTENTVPHFKGEENIRTRSDRKNVSEEMGIFKNPFKHSTMCGKSSYLINMPIFYILYVG